MFTILKTKINKKYLFILYHILFLPFIFILNYQVSNKKIISILLTVSVFLFIQFLFLYTQLFNDNSKKNDQLKGKDFLIKLSPREMDVAVELAKRKTYQEVAMILYIDLETVRSHVRNIYRKMEINSKAELIMIMNTGSIK